MYEKEGTRKGKKISEMKRLICEFYGSNGGAVYQQQHCNTHQMLQMMMMMMMMMMTEIGSPKDWKQHERNLNDIIGF